MDLELLREREAFKRKAMAVPVVENRPAKKDKPSNEAEKAAAKKSAKLQVKNRELGAQSQSAKAKLDLLHMKQMGGQSSMFKFGVLTKIVRHMKMRHMDKEDQPLTLEQVLDETSQLDISGKIKQWLETEALPNNPKVSASQSKITPEGPIYTYLFKPPYNVPNKAALVKLLKIHDRKGLGGIFYEDLTESLPGCERIINNLLDQDRIIVVSRSVDKKKVVFWRDQSEKMQFTVNPEFQKLWRSVNVDSIDDMKIEEYLAKTGFVFMQDQNQKKFFQRKPANKRKANRRKRAPKDNDHMKGILEDYDGMTAETNKVE